MSMFRLVIRNLIYFRWSNVAVLLGMAVATATLTGALMVGDSVRESLRAMAVQRLGPVDYALVSTRFFEQNLSERVRQKVKEVCKLAPAIIVKGGAANSANTARTAGVQIGAVGESWINVAPRRAIINGEVSRALADAKSGDTILYTLATALDTPRDAVLARRSVSEVIAGDRVQVSHVETQPGFVTLFQLEGSQRTPRNLWLNLADLQRAVEQPKRVNAIFASGGDIDSLNHAIKDSITLADYGLAIDRDERTSEAVINSRSTFIEPPVLEAARKIAGETQAPLREVSVYLINDVVVSGTGKAIHYAIAAGLSDPGETKPGDGEVAVNEWTAQQLGIKPGDMLTFSYYQRQAGGGELKVVRSEPLRVIAVLPMGGLGADPSLTPDYKGLTDADSVSDWDPPQGVEIDKSKVTKADEAYWHEHRAAPRLLVSLNTATKLWGGTFGHITSLRIPLARVDTFAAALREKIDPAKMGMTFLPLRERQLAAAGGGTDFAQLFVGFSFFLIAAAALLVAMLFRLNIEQRARQLGMLASIGFAPRTLRGIMLAEGMTLAVLGGILGILGAVGYTWLMVAGLRTWWKGAVGTTAIQLYVVPLTLVIGLVLSLVVALFTVWWSVWRVGRTAEARLLSGGWNDPNEASRRDGRWACRMGLIGIVGGVVLLLAGGIALENPSGAFLGGGGLLLASCLLLLSGQLRLKRSNSTHSTSLVRLGFRNASRHTARSVLSAGLIALAAFTLVTVASLKQGEPQDTQKKTSGAGGYRLILQAAVPLTADLSTSQGRELLGITYPDAEIWSRATFVSMRMWSGQDVSCLNLTRPDNPTILAVPSNISWAGRFDNSKNPWPKLDEPTGDASVVPVIADHETAAYILHLGIGDTMPIVDPHGQARRLKLVATLDHSIFQSELLMSEANFLRLFPNQSGFGTVLVETQNEQDAAEIQRRLATDLESYAVTVDTTAARLASYAAVANTYLSTFQTLGSLGLMLGAVGLGVVLLRGVVERRSELALLSAIGFTPGARAKLVFAENAFLLILGLITGTGCALVGISPTLARAARMMNIPALAATLGTVLVVGFISLGIAIWLGQRRITPADLRAL